MKQGSYRERSADLDVRLIAETSVMVATTTYALRACVYVVANHHDQSLQSTPSSDGSESKLDQTVPITVIVETNVLLSATTSVPKASACASASVMTENMLLPLLWKKFVYSYWLLSVMEGFK